MSKLMKVSAYQGDYLHGNRNTFYNTKLILQYETHNQMEFTRNPLRVFKLKLSRNRQTVTLTMMSFFSKAFPSGSLSPKHMLMVYSGDPPLFSLNCLRSGHRHRCNHNNNA